LSRDLPGTGSKTCACGVSDIIESADFATAARQIASKLAPTASGQNQKPRHLQRRSCPSDVYVTRHSLVLPTESSRDAMHGSASAWKA
jgi:hypothetical protein